MKLKIYFCKYINWKFNYCRHQNSNKENWGKEEHLEEGDRDWTLRWLETDSQGGQNFSRAGALIAKLPK